MHTTHFVTNDPISSEVLNTGLQTAYHDVGSGEALLLVHGFTGSKLDFQDHLARLGASHRVIAYDQRGHGESSNIGPYNLYGLAADLVGLLNALNIEKCHVLGHSLGGMVVMRALLANPERFHSAIFMDTAPYAVKLFDKKTAAQLNSMVMAGGCSALLPGMLSQPQNSVVQRGIDYLGEAEHWRRIRVKLEQMDAKAFVELADTLANQPSVLNALAGLTLPTTIITGEHDTPFLQASKDMHGKLPNSQLITITDAGHCPQYENAQSWAAAVASHFSTWTA
jgi:2-succinyl-6-hydroxy-2,4-cyclohexadiene-1-carboxylate synthase